MSENDDVLSEYLDDETLPPDEVSEESPEVETLEEYGPLPEDPPEVPPPPDVENQNDVGEEIPDA